MSGAQNNGFEHTEDSADTADTALTQRRPKSESIGDNAFISPIINGESVEENGAPDDKKEKRKELLIKVSIHLLTHVIILTYLGFATYKYIESRARCTRDCELAFCSPFGMLLFVIGLTYVCVLYFKIIKPYFGSFIYNSIMRPTGKLIKRVFQTLISRIILGIVVTALFFGYLVFESRDDFVRLRALAGIAIFVSIGLAISVSPRQVKWRPVVCGFIFQFVLGVLFIRWPVGRAIFSCFGDKVAQFLAFGKEGAAFVYSNFLVFEIGVFAFAVLSIIYFFSLCVSILYYLGAMQWVLFKLGWILQSILGTTVCESVNAIGNIFLGMSESPLVIKPYIKVLTHSEIHAVMVSGFSTVSGSVMAAYISFGASPQNLITASVMAAPASLFFAKLVYPELEQSQTSASNIQLEKSSDTSVLDAASNGASQANPLIFGIIGNLVAFIAFIAFADAILRWVTYLLGFSDVGIEFILGKVFMPIAWLIGIPWEDCEAVGNVIGTKTIINEFVAFSLLGRYIADGVISERSGAIATFAICSFANPSSMGILIGGLSALAPERRSTITKVAFRAFISACFVTLVTASIASLLLTEDMY